MNLKSIDNINNEIGEVPICINVSKIDNTKTNFSAE